MNSLEAIASPFMGDTANPFATVSNALYPRTVKEVFQWAEYLWMRQGLYSQVIKSSIGYFLSDFELESSTDKSLSKDDNRKFRNYLIEQLNILDKLHQVGCELVSFGNVFSSVKPPEVRELACPVGGCGVSRRLTALRLDEDYKWENFSFTGKCPNCKKQVTFNRIDHQSMNAHNPLRIVSWNPHNMLVSHNTITDNAVYSYAPSGREKEAIQKGEEAFLQDAPWEFVEAVRDSTYFRFDNKYFKHLKLPVPSVMRGSLKGWALPAFTGSFDKVVQLQILSRFNEAIAMDFIVPMRVMCPPPSSPASKAGPLETVSGFGFMSHVRDALIQHRINPTTVHLFPFPIDYKVYGGEARNLVPVDLMINALEDLFRSMGVPMEFFKPSLSIRTGPPVSLRLFERAWTPYVTLMESWLNWVLDIVAQTQGWQKVRARLIPTSCYEDESLKQMVFQLFGGNKMSGRTAFEKLGMDYSNERKIMLEEQEEEQRLSIEAAKKQQKNQAYADAVPLSAPQPPQDPSAPQQAPQGAPAAGPGGVPPNATIDQLDAYADQIAQQLVSMDPLSRRKTLADLNQSNQQLYALVKAKDDKLTQQAASQGVQMARQGQI